MNFGCRLWRQPSPIVTESIGAPPQQLNALLDDTAVADERVEGVKSASPFAFSQAVKGFNLASLQSKGRFSNLKALITPAMPLYGSKLDSSAVRRVMCTDRNIQKKCCKD